MRRTMAIATGTLVGAGAAVLTASAVFADDRGFGGGFGRHHRDGAVFFMFFPMLLLIAAVVLVALLWRGRHPATYPAAPAAPQGPVSPTLNAQAILADRLARGEISPDDYRASVAVLREPPVPPVG